MHSYLDSKRTGLGWWMMISYLEIGAPCHSSLATTAYRAQHLLMVSKLDRLLKSEVLRFPQGFNVKGGTLAQRILVRPIKTLIGEEASSVYASVGEYGKKDIGPLACDFILGQEESLVLVTRFSRLLRISCGPMFLTHTPGGRFISECDETLRYHVIASNQLRSHARVLSLNDMACFSVIQSFAIGGVQSLELIYFLIKCNPISFFTHLIDVVVLGHILLPWTHLSVRDLTAENVTH